MLKNNLQIAAIQFDIKWESKLENLKVIEEKINQITEVDIIKKLTELISKMSIILPERTD